AGRPGDAPAGRRGTQGGLNFSRKGRMMMRRYLAGLMLLAALVATGCKPDGCASCGENQQPQTSVDGSKYRLTTEPTGVKGVLGVREDAKNEDEVTITGRIGG